MDERADIRFYISLIKTSHFHIKISNLKVWRIKR